MGAGTVPVYSELRFQVGRRKRKRTTNGSITTVRQRAQREKKAETSDFELFAVDHFSFSNFFFFPARRCADPATAVRARPTRRTGRVRKRRRRVDHCCAARWMLPRRRALVERRRGT